MCWTLKKLFSIDGVSPNLIFKGGTSLSKVFSVIHRFSEDVDVSIRRDYLGMNEETDPESAVSVSKQKKLVETLRAECARVTQKVVLPALSDEMKPPVGSGHSSLTIDPNDACTLLFGYPTAVIDSLTTVNYVKPVVRIEMGIGSDAFPIGTYEIRPYSAEEFPAAFTESSCRVTVLEAARTFWEKATIAHQFHHIPADKLWPPRMSRHYYDLMQFT